MIKIFFLSCLGWAASSADPPKVFVDKGACPFECCTYREWSVSRDTPLYSVVKGKKLVGTAKAKSKVTALTGEIHVVPTKIVIKESHGEHKPGDVIYLLTYEGEAVYKVWDKGEIISDGEVYELFENGSPKFRKSWGEPKGMPQSTWWVKIKLPDGRVGWTSETKNFGNMDACGG